MSTVRLQCLLNVLTLINIPCLSVKIKKVSRKIGILWCKNFTTNFMAKELVNTIKCCYNCKTSTKGILKQPVTERKL